MSQKEIQMLVQLREHVRQEFETLEGKGNPVAQMRVQDVAYSYSTIVNSLDEVLRSHVTIE